MIPEADLARAAAKKRVFYVARKVAGRWVRAGDDVGDLHGAIASARHAPDSAVFMATVHGGFIYWRASEPETFNTSLLDEPVENPDPET